MSFFKHLTAVVAAIALLGQMVPVEAKTRKGEKYLAQGRIYEAQKNWDAALEQYARPDGWRQLQRNGMERDFSWRGPAREYRRLYEQLVYETA